MRLFSVAELEVEQGSQGVAYEFPNTVAEQEAQGREDDRASFDPMEEVGIDAWSVVANGERKPVEPPA